jgi:5-methylcytosine-specific restriction endonuclease McrA
MTINNDEYLKIKNCVDKIMHGEFYISKLSEREYYLLMSYLRASSKIVNDRKMFIISGEIVYYNDDVRYELTTKYKPFNKKLEKNLVNNKCLDIQKWKNCYAHYSLSYRNLIQYITDSRLFISDGKCTKNDMDDYIKKHNDITYKENELTEKADFNKSITRDAPEYKKWILNALERDDYTCQCCDSKLNPEVHHILNYAQHKNLRTDDSNSITLCECCHSPMIKGSFHNTYGTRNNTKEQLQEYIDNKRIELGLEPKQI